MDAAKPEAGVGREPISKGVCAGEATGADRVIRHGHQGFRVGREIGPYNGLRC